MLFDSFRYAINPESHEIFSLHPGTVKLQGIEVKAPWKCQDELYPPPHPTFLKLHYSTSIAKHMKGNGDDYELDDDDDDYEELSEPEGVRNENVKIWRLDSSFSSGEITSSLMEKNKGNAEMLADM